MANIRLQDKDGTYNVFNGIDSIVLPTSDGQWTTFSQGGGGGTVTVRRVAAKNINRAIPYSEGGQLVPTKTGDAARMRCSASILVPLDETIEDVLYLAGVQGALASSTTNHSLAPSLEWNATGSGQSMTITAQEDGNLVEAKYDPTGLSIATALENGWDRGQMYGAVFLVVVSSK